MRFCMNSGRSHALALQGGYGGNTASHTHALLKTAFMRARKLGDNPVEPCRRAQEADTADMLPRRPERPTAQPDPRGRRRSILHRRLLALMAGMRQGEICALRWQDVDRVSRKIRVSRAHEGERHLRANHAQDQELGPDHSLRRRARTRWRIALWRMRSRMCQI